MTNEREKQRMEGREEQAADAGAGGRPPAAGRDGRRRSVRVADDVQGCGAADGGAWERTGVSGGEDKRSNIVGQSTEGRGGSRSHMIVPSGSDGARESAA